ncbi:MAG TPA: hypothetical protein ENK57_23080 [Polyangiaceae bacterium]|nr:hypothetical protein [Polyangiaceae bacterium]
MLLFVAGCSSAAPQAKAATERPLEAREPDARELEARELEARELERICCRLMFEPNPSLAMLEACRQLEALGPEPRPVDDTLRSSRRVPPLPEGRVEASFQLDTGGDQMSCRSVEAGIGVVVRVGDQEYRQGLASCAQAGAGDAIASPGALESASCDERFFDLIRKPDAIVVREGGTTLARIPIP